MDQEQTYKQIKFRCLNLKDAIDRKKYCQSIFDKFKLPVEFIDGINSNKMNLSHNIVKGGHIGCVLSHFINLKEIARKNDHNLYVIFEDDISLVDDFGIKLLESIRYLKPINFDIAYIGWWAKYNRYDLLNPVILDDKWQKITEYGHWGNYGYIINGSKSAEKIADLIENDFTDNSDELISKYNLNKNIEALFMIDPIVNFTDNFESQTRK